MKAHTLYLRLLSGPGSCLLSSIIINRTSFKKKKIELPFHSQKYPRLEDKLYDS